MTATDVRRAKDVIVISKGKHVTGRKRAELTATLVGWYAEGASNIG